MHTLNKETWLVSRAMAIVQVSDDEALTLSSQCQDGKQGSCQSAYMQKIESAGLAD